jgi:hypothetical protein
VCSSYKSFGEHINKVLDRKNRDTVNYQQIGSFANFKLIMKAEESESFGMKSCDNRLFVQGNLKYQYLKGGKVSRMDELAGLYPVRALQRIEKELIPQFEKKNEDLKKRIDSLKSIAYFFPNKHKLESAQSRLEEIKLNLENLFGRGHEIQYSLDHSFKRKFGI